MTAEQHTPGPWRSAFRQIGLVTAENGAEIAKCKRLTSLVNMEANARLIAAAPDYHDAARWITQAVTNNAAPVNPIAALEEMAVNGDHVTLDAGLVLDLMKAHAKATGSAA